MMELFRLIHEECQESSDGSILLDPVLLFDEKYKYLEHLLFSALELQAAQQGRETSANVERGEDGTIDVIAASYRVLRCLLQLACERGDLDAFRILHLIMQSRLQNINTFHATHEPIVSILMVWVLLLYLWICHISGLFFLSFLRSLTYLPLSHSLVMHLCCLHLDSIEIYRIHAQECMSP